MSGSYGYNVKWAMVAAGGTFNGSALRFPVVSDTVGLQNEKIDGTGATGTRSIWDAYQRDGVDKVAGQIVFHPTFNLLDALLPYILGAAESPADNFSIADTLPDFDRLKDMSGKVVKHTGLKISRAELKFAPGILLLSLDCLGKAEVSTGLTYSSASLGTDAAKDRPYAFQDCTVSIQSGTRKIRSGTLTIDNGLEAIFSSGSRTAEEIMPQRSRIVTLTAEHPTSSTEWDNLYNVTGAAGNDGSTATVTLAYAPSDTVTSTFTLRRLRAPSKCPVMTDRGEILYQPEWQARHDGTNAEILATNVYSP